MSHLTPHSFCLVIRYGNPAAGDSLASVQEKVDIVKVQMQQNIQQMLLNTEQMEKINASAEQLNEQSLEFKSSTNALKNKMFWKMWKMRLLIGGAIILVLLAIIIPVAIMAEKAKDTTSSS